MADFQPILARAIAGLPDKSPQARHTVYERARSALVAQLRSLDPPLGEAEIMRERLALDEAVTRIEAEYGETAPAAPVAGPVLRAAEPAPPAAALARPASPPAPEPPRQPARETTAFQPQRETTAFRPQRETTAFLPQSDASDQPARPRVTPPRERKLAPGHIRTAVVGGGVAIAVAAIAAAAFYVNKVNPPDQATRPAAETAQPLPDNAGKINDRVGDAPAAPQRPATGQPAQQPAQPGGSEIAVAQRAILYTESAENPQQPRVINGRVTWRLDSESAGAGRPVETIVRATIEIPEAALALDFTIRRNTESTFPASHIIGLRFSQSGNQVPEVIREVGVPQFKVEEGERGAPLSAINSALGDNLFVVAMSSVPVELERNVELLTTRNWIDIPIRFASGRRGIITFEKGISGNQTLTDALQRWK